MADNNKVYVSYHTNGKDFGGSIDVAEMNGEQLTLRQRVQQAEAGATYDFNHLSVINNKLYLAGSAKGKDGKQLGGAAISLTIKDFSLSFSGMALAAIVGIILNVSLKEEN